MRPGLIVCVALATGLLPALASGAPPSKSACIDAYKSSQELSRTGALSQARASALICARDPCPAVLRKDCADWVADIEQRLPTLLVVLRDENGKDLAGAHVKLDGNEVAARVDGRPIEVDPGEHRIEIVAEGRPPLKQSIVAREREKAREVVFSYEPAKPVVPIGVTPPPPKTETPAEKPLPWTFWGAAGVSGVGVLGFGVVGVSGLVLRGSLNDCKPSCSQERIDRGETSFLVADIFLGVAVVGAGIATLIYLTR